MSLAARKRTQLQMAAAYKKRMRANRCCICGRKNNVWAFPDALKRLGIAGHYAHSRCVTQRQKEATECSMEPR